VCISSISSRTLLTYRRSSNGLMIRLQTPIPAHENRHQQEHSVRVAPLAVQDSQFTTDLSLPA